MDQLPEITFSALKKRFIVMILRNLNPIKGNVNGTRYVVENMTSNFLFLLISTDMDEGAQLTLPGISFGADDHSFLVTRFKRLHFLICICFAATVNKTQGKSSSLKALK